MIANSVETLESYGGNLSEFVDFNMELSLKRKYIRKSMNLYQMSIKNFMIP